MNPTRCLTVPLNIIFYRWKLHPKKTGFDNAPGGCIDAK
jgi:hypothetical protein